MKTCDVVPFTLVYFMTSLTLARRFFLYVFIYGLFIDPDWPLLFSQLSVFLFP